MHDDQDQASTEKVDNPLDKARHALGEVLRSGSTPEEIDGYVLLERLGEGGMGEVWLAEQRGPIRRQVALKLIKLGMDTKQVITRFEAERQALALMDHPAVAKVFDAGAAPDGRPYFVMEYVRGVPISEHCDRHRLNTRQRLELFRQVCDGVQHAHQKAIIHRDLKPSNVLVTESEGSRAPKIIDFGVAKATSQKLTERTLFTEQGVMIGTPEYMSPEQADLSREDVDTRTDVYSLGVMLYQLLVGALPFDSRELREAGYDEIRRKIREEEPSRPSTRLSTLGDEATDSARKRRVDLPTLQREIRGDLDWITMRALAKDRSRRYGSPAELSADIDNYVHDRPVVAGPASTLYRMRKLVRRHKVGVALAAAAFVFLAGVAIRERVHASTLATERDRANKEANTSRQVSQFLKDLFKTSDPGEARGNTITAREVLDEGAKKIDESLEDQPEIQAELLSTMAEVYMNLGLYTRAEPRMQRVLEIRRRVLGPGHADTLEAVNNVGELKYYQGKLDEAAASFRRARDGRRQLLGEGHPLTLQSMGSLAAVLTQQAEWDEAERILRRTLDLGSTLTGEGELERLSWMNNLSVVLDHLDKMDESAEYQRMALDGYRRVLGNDHPDTLLLINNMGYTLRRLGKLEEAERHFREVVQGCRRVLGDDHPKTLAYTGNLGDHLRIQGRYEEALAVLAPLSENARRFIGTEHFETGKILAKRARCLRALERYGEAEPIFIESHGILSRTLGTDHPQTRRVVTEIIELYDASDQAGKAARWRKKLAR